MNILQRIGMTEGESRVYLSLLELGSTSTGKIIDKSRITSSKVYVILARLEQKGLVSHIVKDGIKYFQAGSANKLSDYMKEKEKKLQKDKEEINKLIPELLQKQQAEFQETTMFQGINGFKSARDEFIKDLKKGDEYVVFGSAASFEGPFSGRIYDIAKDNEEKGIKTRLLFNEKYSKNKSAFKKYELATIRFVKNVVPTSIAISKSKILMMAYGKEPVQVIITSKNLAQTHHQFFESMWKQAK